MPTTHPFFPRHTALGKGLGKFGMPFYDPARDLAAKTATKPGGPLYDPVRNAILKSPTPPATPTAKQPTVNQPRPVGSTVLAGDSDPFATR